MKRLNWSADDPVLHVAASLLLCAIVLGGCEKIRKYEVITQSSVNDSTDVKTVLPECPPGKVVIGGGARIFGHGRHVALGTSGPEGDPFRPTQWLGIAQETQPTSDIWGLRVDVFCAKVD